MALQQPMTKKLHLLQQQLSIVEGQSIRWRACLNHRQRSQCISIQSLDPLFVQQQVGHRWGSTTALYTGVSGDYRNRTLRRALDAAFTPPEAIEGGSR